MRKHRSGSRRKHRSHTTTLSTDISVTECEYTTKQRTEQIRLESLELPRDPSRVSPFLPNCINFSTCQREKLMQFG